ncbi:MAG: transglycosylase SLT domain-containing protein [Gammaproteobacteria bacterium]|nr:transglycosylase SLT domain-containing protein [Gammaproteobacteria bacterium]
MSVTSFLPAHANMRAAIEATGVHHLEHRILFKQVYPQVKKGSWSSYQEKLDKLRAYPLWPEIRAAYLSYQLKQKTTDENDIREFINTYDTLTPARQLRYHWAISHFNQQDWQGYLDLYQQHYADSNDATLDCMARRAELALGQTDNLWDKTEPLWLVTKSQDKACDPLFAKLKQRGWLTTSQIRQRFELAIDERQLGLASFLARDLGKAENTLIKRWQDMQQEPASSLANVKDFKNNAIDRDLVTYGIERLMRSNFDDAQTRWRYYQQRLDFTEAERGAVERRFLLTAARRHKPNAVAIIKDSPLIGEDLEVTEWTIRAALRGSDWPTALAVIDRLPIEQRNETRWRYWQARGLEASGEVETARAIYQDISKERDFHSFLAADRLGEPHHYNHRPIAVDPARLSMLNQDQNLQRARELYFVDLPADARREWTVALDRLSTDDQLQSARLAHDWGWHSRAIRSLARAEYFDDLDLRYPTPKIETYQQFAQESDIPLSWAYGISRSESLFMPDIRSHAGAIGLMQLMPRTAQETAKEIDLRYQGSHQLISPQVNIQLGSSYLGQMYRRFNNNPVLATAAYNAGPHRVNAWLPDDEHLPADIWVETIPFNETRKYVQRVLSAQVIYHWRLTDKPSRLVAMMPPVNGRYLPATERFVNSQPASNQYRIITE